MKKTAFSVLAATLFLTQAPAAVFASSDNVALRQAVEDMQGHVFWNGGDHSVTVQLATGDATLTIGSTTALVQGKQLQLSTAPTIVNNHTMISSENLQKIQEEIRKNPVLFAFSSVGDSRVDEKTPNISKQDAIWLNNSKVVTRMQQEIRNQNSSMLFFNGDMIMGYTPNSDTNVLNREYAFWRGMMAGMYENGVYVLPVPGNHEVQDVTVDKDGKKVKIATQANENTWRNNMGDVILDENRFQQILGDKASWDPNNYPKNGTDHTTTDQKQLDYSFDYRGTHFAVINTDPAGYDSHAPIEWLKQDLADAKQRGAKHLFVFGHKLAYTYKFTPDVKPGGLDVDKPQADAFWKLIQDNNATYFCGHEHIFNVSQPNDGKAYQVVVGSGGSPFEAEKPTGNPNDRMYAWATTKIYTDGRVHIDTYGFDENYGPTKVIKSFDLEQGF
jgi:hypothetical protein